MHGDYYFHKELEKILNLSRNQLSYMRQHTDLKNLFEKVHVPVVDKLGRRIGRIYKMIHKDNIPEAKEFIKTQNTFNSNRQKQYGWTKSARDCYNIGGNCALCTVFRLIGVQCRMHDKVRQLIEEDKQREMQHGTNSASEGQNDNGNDTKSKKDTVCVEV